MKIVVLWSRLAGYSVEFFKELNRQGSKIILIYQPTVREAPYETFNLSFCYQTYEYSDNKNTDLEEITMTFHPDCVLMSSWNFPQYMRLAKILRRSGAYVVSVMDNQWNGSTKQWLGILSARWFLKKSIDNFLVAGDRQAYFARKLGYDNVLYGCYAANTEAFNCNLLITKREKNFLFIGRLKRIKGVDILVKAYSDYRDVTFNPWKLFMVGTGELAKIVEGVTGIELINFMQPQKLPEIMRKARCFVLPSRFEPWGVVIQEAAASGLPIIATNICGATTAYVRDGVNGYLIGATRRQLTDSMCRITALKDDELESMSEASQVLASIWNPKMLAQYFCSSLSWLSKKSLFCNKD